jgi:preprotein translocase subunit SecB
MSYRIISKFIKDISFEIPNVQTFLMIEKEILNYKLNFDIKSKPFKEKIIEVSTILRLIPNQDVKHKMLLEINMTALITAETNKKEDLEKIILVNVPNELYPTLYETFIYLFKQAGLKDVKINKDVNFEKMYSDKKKP